MMPIIPIAIGSIVVLWSLATLFSRSAESGINQITKKNSPLLFYTHTIMWLVFGGCLIAVGIVNMM